MRVVTYYQDLNVSVIRRLLGPMSVLATRGHQTFAQHVSSLNEIETAGYSAIFLPNWSMPLHERLPEPQGVYIYDLSDPDLLEQEEVVHVIQQCQAVTVPTEALVPIVKAFKRVRVVPSLVASDLFLQAPPLPFKDFVIACVGDHDWRAIAEPLVAALQAAPKAQVVTDNDFVLDVVGTRGVRYPVNAQTYPSLARSVHMALLPRDRATRDTGWVNEFGITGVPSIASPAYASVIDHGDTGLIASGAQQWQDAITKMLTDPALRSRLSHGAQAAARQRTAVRCADQWLATIRKLI